VNLREMRKIISVCSNSMETLTGDPGLLYNQSIMPIVLPYTRLSSPGPFLADLSFQLDQKSFPVLRLTWLTVELACSCAGGVDLHV